MSPLPNEGALETHVESQCHIQEAEETNEGWDNYECVYLKKHRFLLESRQTWQSELSSQVLWPKILTIVMKHKCLIAFNDAMSNAMVEQVTCVVCACSLSRREESSKKNCRLACLLACVSAGSKEHRFKMTRKQPLGKLDQRKSSVGSPNLMSDLINNQLKIS